MSKEHRKYLREQRADEDKQQTRLGPIGLLEPSEMQKAKTETGPNYTQKVMCAYCLWQGPLHKFLISTKKGFHKSQAKCPDCGNGQLIRTLTADMTPEEYAEWMFFNIGYGGWQKVPFNKWKERLAQLGWARQFWDRYKTLKAEYTEEDKYPQDSQEQYEEFMRKHGGEE